MLGDSVAIGKRLACGLRVRALPVRKRGRAVLATLPGATQRRFLRTGQGGREDDSNVYGHLMSRESDDTYFVNALREFLGLQPIAYTSTAGSRLVAVTKRKRWTSIP
jgi:hypothetical protein